MEISGWGRYPRREAERFSPADAGACLDLSKNLSGYIPRGAGRGYGDSALSESVVSTAYLDHFIAFDETTGLLRCEAGVTLETILEYFVPRGWFLPVTPGTQFVTVGGAIASDVHGKNHHLDGSFCNHVIELRMLLGNGEIVTASRESYPDVFAATCGGMGLTGLILSARFKLKPIQSSLIDETTIRCPDLESVLSAFADSEKSTYSVAWIDTLATGRSLGRSLLMLGEHAETGELTFSRKKRRSIPFNMPSLMMNRLTARCFNELYYRRNFAEKRSRRIDYEPFFYPLDGLAYWNRLYGKPGFLQYQFVLPAEAGVSALQAILERIAKSGYGSFLAVLKAFGKGNENLLSFPMRGYTLALDFKYSAGIFDFLTQLDQMVVEQGGRIYLTKDARMSESVFKSAYPHWQEFESVREKYHALGKLKSDQSIRLGLQ